jgi:trehalose synthase-fused probable maltokinase
VTLAERVESLSSDELLSLIAGERWFASKAREPESAEVVGCHSADGEVVVALVEVRFPEGTHDTYALALGEADGRLVDALADARLARELLVVAGVRAEGRTVRPMGVEQSNSSVVVDERHVLKLYRRLEAGPNPELEMLRVLGARGFAHAPPLQGEIEHREAPIEATLALVAGYVPAHGGGWELALASLSADREWLPSRARRLGEVTGAMHAALAADPEDPHFAPEEPSAESVAILAASVDEEIERVFRSLPELPALEPIAGRSGELRDLSQGLAQIGPPGLAIRVHGDYHLGQVLWSNREDWVVIDFEGEPARSLPERRNRYSPLRDVAGMVRSFAYAEDAARLLNGVEVPEGWEERCRASFLQGYHDTVDPRLLPAGNSGSDNLLALFELQKLVYELRYELGNRPAWVSIPVAGLLKLLEARE